MKARNVLVVFAAVALAACGSLPDQNGGSATARTPAMLTPVTLDMAEKQGEDEDDTLERMVSGKPPRSSESSHETNFAPVRPQPRVPRQGANPGSLYQAGGGRGLYDDGRASRVGDILTIELSENTTASWNISGNRSHSNDLEVENPNIFGADVQFNAPSWFPLDDEADNNLGMNFSSSGDFQNNGSGSQDNNLEGEITVTVVEVLANGNMVIRGEKQINLSGNEELIQVSGIVRPRDVGPDNVVESSRLANARIAYAGSEMMAEMGQRGWLGDFLGKVWPF
jgi:flagellar L-ring protein precursor FlgH